MRQLSRDQLFARAQAAWPETFFVVPRADIYTLATSGVAVSVRVCVDQIVHVRYAQRPDGWTPERAQRERLGRANRRWPMTPVRLIINGIDVSFESDDGIAPDGTITSALARIGLYDLDGADAGTAGVERALHGVPRMVRQAAATWQERVRLRTRADWQHDVLRVAVRGEVEVRGSSPSTICIGDVRVLELLDDLDRAHITIAILCEGSSLVMIQGILDVWDGAPSDPSGPATPERLLVGTLDLRPILDPIEGQDVILLASTESCDMTHVLDLLIGPDTPTSIPDPFDDLLMAMTRPRSRP